MLFVSALHFGRRCLNHKRLYVVSQKETVYRRDAGPILSPKSSLRSEKIFPFCLTGFIPLARNNKILIKLQVLYRKKPVCYDCGSCFYIFLPIVDTQRESYRPFAHFSLSKIWKIHLDIYLRGFFLDQRQS